MIQVGKLRNFVNEDGKKVIYFKSLPGLYYDNLKVCFDTVEQDIRKFPESEQHNLFYTVAHHLRDKRTFDSWQAQEIIPFDLDGIDLTRIDEYAPLLAKTLEFDLSKCAVVYSGNGVHVLIQVMQITKKSFIKDVKLGYRQLLDRFVVACEEEGLPLDKDTTAWDYARILRLPFTKNIKVKEGVEVIKEATLKLNGLTEQPFLIPQVTKPKKTLSKGSFGTPDKETILTDCDFMRWLKIAPDDVHEPQAYAMLSITGHFDDDNKTSEDYWQHFSSPSINSKNLAEFTEQALASSGPRTCEGINDVYGKCDQCPNYNKVTSPIVLKSKEYIGTAAMGFTTLNTKGTGRIRRYDDLLTHFDNTYKHKSVGAINKIYLWHDSHYRITDDLFIRNFADKSFIPYPKSDEKREFLSKVKDSNYTDQSFLDNDKARGHVNLANGILELDSGKILKHEPEFEFLYCLPFDYDPEATSPLWDNFIDDVTLGRPCLKNIIHEYLGYIISGSNYKYQKALILDGAGNNGKTTFLKVLKKLVGNTNISNLALGSLQSQVFASAGLHGKLCNISEEEPPKTFKDQSGVFKNLTGDGVVNAQHKFGNPFEFDNKAKVVITYNDMPYVSDTTEGMLRRLLITPWDFDISKHPDKKDPDIEYKLYAELSGIFNRCLEGWYRLEKQKNFTNSEYVNRKVKQVHLHSDVVLRFLEDYTEKINDDSYVDGNALFEKYGAFQDDEGDHNKRINKNTFYARLRKHGYEVTRKHVGSSKIYVVGGLKLWGGASSF